MKDLPNLKTSMKAEIEKVLNNQIKTEAHASSTYLAMSAWCGDKGYDGSADFFAKQAEEERTHMLKLFKYLNDRVSRAITPEIVNITTDFQSLRGLFEKTLQMEMHVTQLFNDMAEKCIEQKDFVTFQFIQWFLEEQVQEEYIARRILDLFDVIGEEGKGCWEIDKQVPKVKYEV